jgi:hypothetical protein
MEFDVMDVKQISSKKMSHGGGYWLLNFRVFRVTIPKKVKASGIFKLRNCTVSFSKLRYTGERRAWNSVNSCQQFCRIWSNFNSHLVACGMDGATTQGIPWESRGYSTHNCCKFSLKEVQLLQHSNFRVFIHAQEKVMWKENSKNYLKVREERFLV